MVAAVGRTPVARVWTVARAQVVAPGSPGQAREVERDKEAKRAAVVKRVREVKPDGEDKRVQAVHRASTARCRCNFGSIGSMSKVEQRR